MEIQQYSNTQKYYKFLYQENNNIKNLFFSKDYISHKTEKNKIKRKRLPGIYPDIYSIKKEENNILILHSCKLLKAYYNEEGIKALVLDGKKLRTTRRLNRLGDRLKEIIIVEYNKETFREICNKTKKYNYIKCYNEHINDYVKKYNNPKINVVYFDLMETFFSSNSSHGSDLPIIEFLEKSEVDELIFASTFCLRNTDNFEIEVNKILLFLELIFSSKNFEYKKLIFKKKMRYKGQTANNKALMFVLYYLKKNNEDNQNDVNNEEINERFDENNNNFEI